MDDLEQSNNRRAQILLTALLFGLLNLRRPFSLPAVSFLAEDGAVFFRDHLLHGWSALSIPVAGYLQTIPRLVAGLLSIFPTAAQPALYTLSSHLLLAAALGSLISPRYRFLIRSDAMRASAAVVIVSAFQGEHVIGTSFNLYWFLWPFALLPLFDKSKRSYARLIFETAAVSIIALSAPILAIALPFAAAAAIKEKGAQRALSLIFIVLVSAQLILFSTDLQEGQPEIPHIAPTVSALRYFAAIFTDALCVSFLYRCFLTAVAGQDTAFLVASWGSYVTKPLFFSFAAAAALLYWRNPEKRPLIFCACYFSAASIAAALYARNMFWFFVDSGAAILWTGERYFVPAFMLLVLLTAAMIESLRTSELKRLLLFGLIFAGGVFGNFSLPHLRDPLWPKLAGQIDAWKGQPGTSLAVPIHPAGWAISLTPPLNPP